ncbi:MAG: hypothetical protein IKL31_05525, partial [Ruminococcus sp.]|nr:hypothetical protein [Ruminococcus sp.]
MMNNSKLYFKVAFLSILSLAMFGCSNKDSENKTGDNSVVNPELRQKINEVSADDELLTGELENKTIKWMASWDINKAEDVPVDLA